MCEDILCHIMTKLQLQSQSIATIPSEFHLNILRASRFWKIIFHATGSVGKLNSNSFVNKVKASISELGGSLLKKTIDITLLQQLLQYSDEELFYHFDAAVAKKKTLADVIVSREEIATIRMECNDFQHKYDILFKFYGRFCSTAQDVNIYLQQMQSSDKLYLNQVLVS